MLDVLVICDDLWHPGEVVRWGLAPLESEFNFTYITCPKDMLTPEFIADYPVILCAKGDRTTPANEQPWFEETTEVGPFEFETYVKEGGGFLAVHAGNTARFGKPYGEFVGNYFLGHPPRTDVTLHITQDHPVTKGIENFTIRDEHYQMVVIAPDAKEILRSTSATGGDQPAGYVREMGKGRLCALTPGHILSAWRAENYQKLLRNAILWCAKKEK